MKKSFSVLLSAAVAFGSFASLASAADDLTAQQKFDALKEKGIFAGVDANGSAGLDQNMNRAQFARVAALILGLEGIGATDTKQVTEKPFPDVALGQWYTEEVAAVKEAKVLVGNADGTFNPTGNISVQELAVVTANVLGLKAVEGAKIEGAADWAAGYIQAIKDAGVSFPTNYTQAATRSQLVEVSFQADAKINPVAPAKVSVASAKATGVKTVTVTLDKAVDDTKATLTLKRGTATVATTAKWSDDKKTATLTLTSTKIMEGEYSVTLAGLASEEIATASATFTAQNEKVSKLEFVSPSDTIAQSSKVKVEFAALNQYEEAVSLPAGNFNPYASTPAAASVTKDANGKLFVVLDTDDINLPVGSQISVNIVNNESQMSVNKIFKLGTKPYVSKVELGKVTYSNGQDYLSKNGDKAVIELIQLDQYGHQVTDQSGSLYNASVNVTPYLDAIDQTATQVVDDNNDEVRDVVVKLKADAKASGQYTVNVFGGTSASTTINIKSTNYAATVELDSSVTLAEGDADKYISITAYDKEGNKLSAQDIVDNYTSGHIQFSASSNLQFGDSTTHAGVSTVPTAMLVSPGLAVVKTGEHKGKLHIASVTTKGYANIFVNINPTTANGILFNKNFQFNVQEKRYPVALKAKDDSAAKAVTGAKSTLKVVAIDQFGDEIKGTFSNINDGGKSVSYEVYVTKVATGTTVTFAGAAGIYTNLSSILDTGLDFDATAGAIGDAVEVKFALRKIDNGSGKILDDQVSAVVRKMEVINPKTTKLVYSVKGIDTLFDAVDDKTMENSVTTVGVTVNADNFTSKHARAVGVEAKTGNEAVAIPDYVQSVTSSEPSIVQTNSQKQIIGVKAGTATITVFHTTATGEYASLTKEVTVKSDPISVASLSADAKSASTNTIATTGGTVSLTASELMKLIAKDNYNTEYKAVDGANPNYVVGYDKVLNIRYTISEVQGGGSVTVDNNISNGTFGQITITGNVDGFTLTAIAPSGQSAVTAVTVPH
ncbi:S-layer homology domain-containing protein [Cohnella panacarvi]|uniref:S-layer homology domain-containing protein n=1 Tax=Cohnella panacarvi TaxID=400776 RepID=UPI000478C971|nr:S-layer homology domain-containing protein [Cohnella panacarvi]